MSEFSLFHWLVLFGLFGFPVMLYALIRLVKKAIR